MRGKVQNCLQKIKEKIADFIVNSSSQGCFLIPSYNHGPTVIGSYTSSVEPDDNTSVMIGGTYEHDIGRYGALIFGASSDMEVPI